MIKESEEGFIGRWSRRKRQGQQEDVSETESALPAEDARSLQESEERRARLDANRAAAEAVDLDAIGYESDLSVFYREGVPALLKQAALRKMWRSDAVFANLDGLNDYDHDYNVIDRILTEFKSAWQLGRGYAQTLEETAEAPGAEGGEEPKDGAPPVSAGSDDDIPVADTQTGDPANREDQGAHATLKSDAAEMAGANDDDGREEPEASEEARPSVSLRQRMARFGPG